MLAFPTERRTFFARDGVSLEAELAGDHRAPLVVLMHGGGQTRHSWLHALQTLATTGYRAVAYDTRGHGDSGWSPDGHYSFVQRADDLGAILDDLGSPRVALVGASMGGMTAMQAIGHGLPVAALVVVDIVLRPSLAGVQRVRDFMSRHLNGFATLEEAVEAVAAYNPKRPRPKDSSGLMRNLRLRADGRLYWHWDPRIVPDDLGGDYESYERIAQVFRPGPELPVMLVRGGESDVVTERDAEEFQALVPHVEIHNVAHAGHMLVGDSNRAFNQAILGFLQRHMPPADATGARPV